MHILTPLLSFVFVGFPLFISMSCGLIDISSDDPGDEKKSTTVIPVFQLGGAMPMFEEQLDLFSASGMSQNVFKKRLKKASRDIKVSHIVIHLSTLGTGWGRVEELSHMIADAGEHIPLTCVLESADNKTYWLAATGCPTIVAAPAAGIDLVGLSMETLYFRELLDKLGIQADMLHIGDYKTAAENITRNDMSPDARVAATALLKSIEGIFVDGISTARDLPPTELTALIDKGPFTANSARHHALVDEVSTISAHLETLKTRHKATVVTDYGKRPPKEMGLTDILGMLSKSGQKPQRASRPTIALIFAEGPISNGFQKQGGLASSQSIIDMPLVQTLLDARDDTAIKAIVLRIDSPGGSALASDNLWDAIRLTTRKKPVVISLGDMAASGGYYMASAGTYIFANHTTITGSIGVVGGKMVIGDGLTQLGIHRDAIHLSTHSGILSPFEPFSDSERAIVKQAMNQVYRLFVKRVATGRELSSDAVEQVAQGRVWTGAQALEAGLIDEIGTLENAIDKARALVDAPNLETRMYPRPQSFLEFLGEQLSGKDARTRLILQTAAGRHALQLSLLLAGERVLAIDPIFWQIQ